MATPVDQWVVYINATEEAANRAKPEEAHAKVAAQYLIDMGLQDPSQANGTKETDVDESATEFKALDFLARKLVRTTLSAVEVAASASHSAAMLVSQSMPSATQQWATAGASPSQIQASLVGAVTGGTHQPSSVSSPQGGGTGQQPAVQLPPPNGTPASGTGAQPSTTAGIGTQNSQTENSQAGQGQANLPSQIPGLAISGGQGLPTARMPMTAMSTTLGRLSRAEEEQTVMLVGGEANGLSLAAALGAAQKAEVRSLLSMAGLGTLPFNCQPDDKVFQVLVVATTAALTSVPQKVPFTFIDLF